MIRVRFIADAHWSSRLIRYGTGSLFSHVEIGDGNGGWIGAHIGDGIQDRPANYCQTTREYVYEIPANSVQTGLAIRWAQSKIGGRYDWRDILGMVVGNRRLRSPQAFICSGFVTECLIGVFGASRVLNVQSDWTYRITPEELHLSPIFVGNLKSRKG